MLCREVQNYISTAKGLPFFYVVGDEDYSSVLEELKQVDISIVRMSDFCFKDDKFPSVDELVDYFRTSDVIETTSLSSSVLVNILHSEDPPLQRRNYVG